MVKEVASKQEIMQVTEQLPLCFGTIDTVTIQLKNVAAGANPMDLKRGIDKAVAKVVEASKVNHNQLAKYQKDRTVASVQPITILKLEN